MYLQNVCTYSQRLGTCEVRGESHTSAIRENSFKLCVCVCVLLAFSVRRRLSATECDFVGLVHARLQLNPFDRVFARTFLLNDQQQAASARDNNDNNINDDAVDKARLATCE